MNDDIYRGVRLPDGGTQVTVNGERLDPRLDRVNHSPAGLEWGYSGSGCAQLALAILAHHCASDESRALQNYQEFKVEVIARLRRDGGWRMPSGFVEDALSRIEAHYAIDDSAGERVARDAAPAMAP